MKKKLKKEVESVKKLEVTGKELDTTPAPAKILKLEIELGRGDLNLLRDKINEVIDKQNGTS